MERLGDPAGGDPDHAGVPAALVDDERDRVVLHQPLGDLERLVARLAVQLAAAQVERLDRLDEAGAPRRGPWRPGAEAAIPASSIRHPAALMRGPIWNTILEAVQHAQVDARLLGERR